ncbi:GtrA family protein [Rivibacter subsaxonicus]|uniref:Putative flippase GtrA n=1 Tax=Rivibacter subsaxonicus TaxID=457575 RepID=A0A4V2FSP3_9BURK|nr:GtrA family protein [Rivibacter subsaxonicus]RZT94955.1 putative flippase GtrA [Rivibacter subsaxonicus]
MSRLATLTRRVMRWRFSRFALVGLSGTVINTVVLYLAQEYWFAQLEPFAFRLNFSLALAIFVATVSNFLWNRGWTWGDRNASRERSTLRLFGQYCMAAGGAIAIQFVMAKWLADSVHYLLGNLIAIGVSALFNYAANDLGTFRNRRHKPAPVEESRP